MQLFLDIISLELALILIQDHILHMHLSNMIEVFFDLLTQKTKWPPLLRIISLASPFELMSVFIDLTLLP